jgi:transposase
LTLSKTQESQILELYYKGLSQRRIAKEIEVCLDSVNKRLKLFRVTGSIHKGNIQRSRYNPIENATRQRIRYYLSLEKRKSRFTVNQLYDFLVQEGYEITKSKVRQWIKLERNRLKDSFLDIFYEPGQMVQFDWGSKKIKISGINKIVYFAVFALPFSNYRYVHVTEKMNAKCFVDAFISFTKHIGCIFPILLIDNMKIAVKHRSFKDNQVKLTLLFEQLSQYYNMEVRTCTPYRPNQKGTVENAVSTLKRELHGLNNNFKSLEELQNSINTTFDRLNKGKHPDKNNTCMNLMKNERAFAGKVPSKHFVYFNEVIRIVKNNTLVSFDGNHYSAPEEYKGERITVRYNEKTIKLVSNDGRILAKYKRCFGKGYKKYRVWNMIHSLQKKSEGFDQSNQKRQMPTWLKKLYEREFQKESKDFLVFIELIQNVSKKKLNKCLNIIRFLKNN